jgi:MFS family permease|tara:strand:- start:2474 stop:3655 length:1182 start_codon:yes stop_codon:yes gene_type:complete
MPIFKLLKIKSFNIYLGANGINEIGFMTRLTAIGWLSYELSGSPLFVGILAAANGMSMSLLSFFGGVLADRYSKPIIIIISKFMESLIFLLIAILIQINKIDELTLIILMFVNGILAAIYVPSRIGFVKELSGSKLLLPATALDFGIMTLVGTFAPALAGVLIDKVSLSFTLYFSFGAYILHNLLMLPLINKGQKYDHSKELQIIKSIKYIFNLNIIKYLFIIMLAIAILIFGLETLSPVIAKDIFNTGPTGFGILLSSAGFGMAVASLTVASLKSININKLLTISIAGGGLTLIVFAFSPNYLVGLILFAVLFSLAASSESAITTLIQTSVPDNMRGKVISIQTFTWGISSLTGILSGYISQQFGITLLIFISGIILLTLTPITRLIAKETK